MTAAGMPPMRSSSGEKECPGGKVHTESTEETGRDFVAVNVLGCAGICQVKAGRLKRGDLIERACIALPIKKVGIREVGSVLEAPIVEQHDDQAIGLCDTAAV